MRPQEVGPQPRRRVSSGARSCWALFVYVCVTHSAASAYPRAQIVSTRQTIHFPRLTLRARQPPN